MKNLSLNGIYVDALTGLENFFKFIESDMEEMCGDNGSVVVVDVINFSKINEDFGREMGDICLLELALVLSQELVAYEKSRIFRTGGDEFIIILKETPLNDAQRMVELIEKKYVQLMAQHQVKIKGLHNLIVGYSHLMSMYEFLEMFFKKSWANGFKKEENKNWTRHMVETFTYKIRESIALLNGAYELALTDDISKLPNHRSARLYLEKIVKDHLTENAEFSLLFIDGDNLKRYNSISYNAGNEMIKKLSVLIADSIRTEDKVFRWLSGDEFLVILNNVRQMNVDRLAERVRSVVEEETLDWSYPITVSIGVSSYPDDGVEIEDLIMKAEKANFHAKGKGKNRVIFWRDLEGKVEV